MNQINDIDIYVQEKTKRQVIILMYICIMSILLSVFILDYTIWHTKILNLMSPIISYCIAAFKSSIEFNSVKKINSNFDINDYRDRRFIKGLILLISKILLIILFVLFIIDYFVWKINLVNLLTPIISYFVVLIKSIMDYVIGG